MRHPIPNLEHQFEASVAAYFANERPLPRVAEALVELALTPLEVSLSGLERDYANFKRLHIVGVNGAAVADGGPGKETRHA